MNGQLDFLLTPGAPLPLPVVGKRSGGCEVGTSVGALKRMRCRNGTAGVGDFDCLYGFPCDGSTGECDCLGSQMFVHDTALFRIPNCGLPVPALATTYVLAAIGALFTCIFSLCTARGRKRSTQQFLWVGAIWTALLAVLQVSHYLEGMIFGPATIVLFYLTIQAVNVQVIMFTFQIFSLLALLAKPVVLVRLRSFLKWWLVLWSLLKVVPAILLLIGDSLASDDMFNGVVLAWAVLIMAEVSINTTGQYLGITRLVRELDKVTAEQSSYFASQKVQSVLQFGARLRKVLPIALSYAILVGVLCCVLFGLFAKFGFAIPHAWIWYMLMVIAWPMLALQCVLLSRDATVKQIEGLERTDPKEHTFSLFEDRGKIVRKAPGHALASGNKVNMVQIEVPEISLKPKEPPTPGSPSFSGFLNTSSLETYLGAGVTANPTFKADFVNTPTPSTLSALTQAVATTDFLDKRTLLDHPAKDVHDSE